MCRSGHAAFVIAFVVARATHSEGRQRERGDNGMLLKALSPLASSSSPLY